MTNSLSAIWRVVSPSAASSATRIWRVTLGKPDPLPGYIDSRAHIFACDVAEFEPKDRVLEDGATQHIPTERLTRSTVRQAILSGQITEMQAVAAFLLADAAATAVRQDVRRTQTPNSPQKLRPEPMD